MVGWGRLKSRPGQPRARAHARTAPYLDERTVVLRAAPQEAAFGEVYESIREVYESIDEFLAGIVQAPVATLEVTDVVADAPHPPSQERHAGILACRMLRALRREHPHADFVF